MSYEGRRNNSEFSGNEASPIDDKAVKKQQEQHATEKALKTTAKGAATYFAGPLGGKAVDAIANTKAGQQILNKGGQALNKMPGIGKAAKTLDDSGITDTADKAINVMGAKGGSGGAPNGAASGTTAAANQAGANIPENGNSTNSSQNSSQDDSGGLKSLGGGGSKPKSNFDDDSESTDEEEQNGIKSLTGGKSVTSIFGQMTSEKAMIIAAVGIGAIILLLIAVVAASAGSSGEFEDAFGVSIATGGEYGDIYFTTANPAARDFYERINEVKLEYQAKGKTIDALKVVAVYHVLNTNDLKYDYDYMTKSRIEEIADAMFSGNSYSEDTFRTNLTNDIFKKYFPTKSKETRENYTDDVFEYIENYYSIIGQNGSICAASGTCVYTIKGFRINNNRITKEMNINNLMVRLMECGEPYGSGSYTTAIDQDLVPFEDYAAGVAYAEVGPSAHIEVLKAQIVMARSFALARPTGMGNNAGKKLEEENGQWILQISSCVADQVFCNINEGCSYMGGGSQSQGGVVRSGHIAGAINYRDALPEDHNIRIALSETLGEVLVDQEGYIIQTSYTSTTQNKLSSLASQGYNYKQMLMSVYSESGAFDIEKMTCNTGSNSACGMVSTGPFATWKQYEGPWINVQMGNSGKTIKQIGCLATSVAILIAKSGVETNIQGDFNPGTFVEFLNNNNGFVSGGNFVWASATKAAPNFVYQGQISVSGYTKAQKLNKIVELLNAGYYVVAEVKGNTGQHWVAIDTVQDNTIVMMDPGSSSTDMWGQYNWVNTSTLAYFKVN